MLLFKLFPNKFQFKIKTNLIFLSPFYFCVTMETFYYTVIITSSRQPLVISDWYDNGYFVTCDDDAIYDKKKTINST